MRALPLCTALLGLGASACASGPAAPNGGGSLAAPEILFNESFESVKGSPKTLDDLRGKVVLVDFFATWCLPCADSLPVYNRWQKELGGRGFSVVLVSVDETPEEVPAFISRLAPELRVVWDQGGRVAGRLGLPGMPTAFLIGRDGQLLLRHEGFRPGDESELRDRIGKALGAP